MRRENRPRIQRRWFVIGGIVLLLIISISSIVGFYTDILWFDELGFTPVFWTILWTRVGVGVVGGAIAAVVVYVNLEVARRGAPRHRFVPTGGPDITEQYRSAFRPYARLASIVVAALVGLFTGLSTSGAWERFLLWRNARPFGVDAPEPFGQDVSFYVFSIPFQRSVLSLLFGVLVVSLLLAAVAHLFNGSIQPEANRVRVGTVVKVHLSVLLGLIALLKAWAYRLDQFELVYSPRGTVTGASYTDVNAQLPALRLLMIIALVAAAILFANVFRSRGWLLPGAAIALWAFSSILLGAIIPAAVQRFQVTPNESQRESEFIERNIEYSRRAYGLSGIDVTDFRPEPLRPGVVERNRGTIDNIRIWDPSVLHPTYQRLQAIRTYYEFDDIDIDRYILDGDLTQVMLSAREVDPSKLEASAQNWVNTRLTYTHGYGIVANAANAVTPEGLPSFLVRDLPPEGIDIVNPEESAIYYGERMREYSVVNTRQEEIDFPTGDEDIRTTSYEGDGGIELSNIMRRLAFAVRFGDTDLLLSRFITPESRVIMRRNIVERASVAAPFLRFDSDPYIVSADEKLYWILDAYTVSDRFPYSERINLGQLFGGMGNLSGEINYMRNPIKVVVDAYDGTMRFYLIDPSDALASTYQAAFPELFTPGDEMPDALREHIRYPEDLFKVQAWQYRLYHIDDPEQFYAREDAWDVPVDPVQSSGQNRVFMEPYYVVMKLPGQENEEFLLMLPFTPRDRPILNGWVAARMDGENYGELVGLSFPRGVTIDSPQNISARINQTDEIAEQFTLWDRAGSRVDHGPIFVVPIEQSLVYVQPIYLRAEDAERALPELRRVIVVAGDRIGFEATLEESLAAALEGRELTVEEEDGQPPPGDEEEPAEPTGNVSELLQQAVEHFERAEEALRQGDLAAYQRENEAGRRAVEEAQQQSGG